MLVAYGGDLSTQEAAYAMRLSQTVVKVVVNNEVIMPIWAHFNIKTLAIYLAQRPRSEHALSAFVHIRSHSSTFVSKVLATSSLKRLERIS